MTPVSTLRRIGAPLAAAAMTALLFTAVLWVQRARGGWPFDTAPAARQTEALAGIAATTGPEATHGRVPVEATATGSLDIRLLALILVVAAVAGDAVNYAIGRTAGHRVIHLARTNPRWGR